MVTKADKSLTAPVGTLFILAFIIGSAAICSFVILIFLDSVFLNSSSDSLGAALLSRLLFIFGSTIVVYVFSFKHPALWLNNKVETLGFCLVLLIVLLVLPAFLLVDYYFGFNEHLWLSAFSITGIGFGFALITWNSLWTSFYCAYLGKHTYQAIFGTVCLIAFFCFPSLFAPNLVCYLLIAFFGAVSVGSIWICCRYQPKLKHSNTQSVIRYRLPLRAITHVAVLGLFFGYSTGYAYFAIGFSNLLFITLPVLLLTGLAIIVIPVTLKRPLSFALAGRIAFPVSIFGLLFVWLPDHYLAAIFQFVFALIGCCFFAMYHWGFISHWSARYEVLPIAQAAFGTIAPLSGTLAGWSLFSVLIFLDLTDELVIVVFALLMLFAFILVSAIMPFGSELRIVDAERSIQENRHDSTGIWKSSLHHISQTSGLTPREQEIFALLAGGRNIGYISEHLVISNHTTKSHVYRIYSKLNINSQQELISLAENYAKEIKRLK